MGHPLPTAPEADTLEHALADLRRATSVRHLLPQGTTEYALALKAEVRLSETVYELAHEARVSAGAAAPVDEEPPPTQPSGRDTEA
jgi:hypothetical protein